MFKKILFILLFLTLFFVNSPVFASEIDDIEQNIDNLEQYLTIKNKVSEDIIRSTPQKFNEKWKSCFLNENGDALIVVTMLATKNIVKFFAVNYPLDVAYNITKETINLVKIINTGDMSRLIGEIEKVTVNKAVEYAMDELLKNQVRVGSGIMETDYITNKGTKSNVQVNYIVTHKQIKDDGQKKEYETVIRFYSPKSIDVPSNKFWGNSEMVYENKERIDPFIITVNGKMKFENFTYFWIGSPKITIEYPEVVPNFEFKPTSFWEEKIVKPIKESLKSLEKLLGFFGASVFDSFKAKDLEKIENNEELKELSKDIQKIEEEIEEEIEKKESWTQTNEEFAQKVAELNLENDPKNNEEVLPNPNDEMSEEELRALLIRLYNELVKRKLILNDLVDESNEEEKEKEKKKEKETVSFCSYQGQNPLRNNLIINEVAWMGTSNSSSDEWIELKNIGNTVLDLKGYQLLDKANQIEIIFEELKINPGDYVLLERTDDNSVPGIKADVIYKGNLNNKEESLYLYNSECLLEDIVVADPDWPAGTNDPKKSMERKPDLSWQTYSGDFFGTPRAENSKGKDTPVPLLENSGGGGGTSINYCSQNNLKEPLRSSVIINEVAWMGTTNQYDEWIELKNITDQNISLKGYQLLDKNDIKIVFESTDIIEANGFYLLERVDDNAVPGIKADKIYSGTLSNSNESLRLFSNECVLIDEVVADSKWPAGTNEPKKSMERKTDLSWQTYSGDSFGTPRAENSKGTVLPGSGGINPPKEEITYCSQNNLGGALRSPVIINEVAWMGTTNQYDEWIELKNITDQNISLKGYQLLDKNDIKIVFESTDIIEANGFYLLERVDDNAVPGVKADKIYSGILVNDNESLRLFNDNCVLIDEVVADPKWPAGTNEPKKSMERKPDLSWQTYSGDSFGTPRAENSVANTSENIYGKGLVITDVSAGHNNDEREYVKIYNQSDQSFELCSDDKCTYIAYFNVADGAEWDKPNYITKLPNKTLAANSYFQIDFNRNNRGDFHPADLPEMEINGYFNSRTGSVCLFDKDIRSLTIEEAQKARIDCVGWFFEGDPIPNNIKEGDVFPINNSILSDVISRKFENNLYIDRNNNSIDFISIKPLIYTIPAVLNFKFTELEDKTKLKLSWDFDESINMEEISYELLYTKNSSFDNKNNIIIEPQKNITLVEKHAEITISSIEEGIDYRFVVKMSEAGGNESSIENPLFYVYSSSYNDHMYALPRYDLNRTNKTEFIGPQAELTKKDLVLENFNQNFSEAPLIDKYGNLFLVYSLNTENNVRIVSYDKNGLFRWGYDMSDSTLGELFLSDALYYLSRDMLIKFSLTGKETICYYSFDVSGYKNFLYKNNNLYFQCNTSGQLGLCKINIQESLEAEILYSITSTFGISKLFMDEEGNIFFIEDSSLVKVAPDKTFEKLDLGEGVFYYSCMQLLKNRMVVYSFGGESSSKGLILIDTDNMKTIGDPREDELHSIAIGSNGFYLFENVGFYDRITFLDISNNSFTELSPSVERMNFGNFSYAIIDGNDNIYYISEGNNLIGLKIEGKSITKLFANYVYKNASVISLINGKIYCLVEDGIIEFSF